MGSTAADVRDVAVAFSRALGEPSGDLVVLVEGTPSMRGDNGTMLVNMSDTDTRLDEHLRRARLAEA